MAERSLRCQARHGQKTHLQCTDYATHAGAHYAVDVAAGLTYHWQDSVTVYPPAEGANASQVGGNHYRKFAIQPWDVIDEYELSFYAGSALKYLLRAGNKGSKVEDLRKCRHYLDKLIEIEEGK